MTPQEELAQLHKKWAGENVERDQAEKAAERERRILIRERFRNGEFKNHFAECRVCGLAILSLNHEAACPIGKAHTPTIIGGTR
jgi:rubrerythrin